MAESTPAPPVAGKLRQAALALALGLAIVAVVYLVERGNEARQASPIAVAGSAGGSVPRVGQPAADFTLNDLDGKPVTLSSFRGRPVWINFWATWCAPCRVEFPEMDAVYREYQGKGLVLLAVSYAEEPSAVATYIERTKPAFTVLTDPPGDVASLYRVLGLPTHVFIDANGIIREVRIGPMNQELMRAKLAQIMG